MIIRSGPGPPARPRPVTLLVVSISQFPAICGLDCAPTPTDSATATPSAASGKRLIRLVMAACLFRCAGLVRCADARGAGKQPPAVGKRHLAPVRHLGSVLRQIPFD